MSEPNKNGGVIGAALLAGVLAGMLALHFLQQRRIDREIPPGYRYTEKNDDAPVKTAPYVLLAENTYSDVSLARVSIVDERVLAICGGRDIFIEEKPVAPGRHIFLTFTPNDVAGYRDNGEMKLLAISQTELYAGNEEKFRKIWAAEKGQAFFKSLATDGHLVFIADAGEKLIHILTVEGKYVRAIGAKNAEKNIPGLILPSPYMDVALAKDGLLRVTNCGRHRVESYTVEGDLEHWWGKPSARAEDFCGCCNPIAIALLPDGGYVTAEKGKPRVKLYDSDGNFSGVLVQEKDFSPGDKPDVAVDADGKIYVLFPTQNRIAVYGKITDAKSE